MFLHFLNALFVNNCHQRFAAMRRAGLLPGIVLLKTFISRIRNLSTEDGFPAWRLAAVLVAQPKILKINFVNIITKFYITI